MRTGKNMYQKRNENEFDCPSCGNPLFKSRNKDFVRCTWCHMIVDYKGNILPSPYKEKVRKNQDALYG